MVYSFIEVRKTIDLPEKSILNGHKLNAKMIEIINVQYCRKVRLYL